MMPRLPRRWFLGLATLFALLGRDGAAAAALPSSNDALEALLPRTEDAALVGRAYLAQYATEGDADLLRRSLVSLAAEPRSLRRAIGERIRRDFAEGDTVRVEGWVLARTEARLCALCALSKDRSAPVAHGSARPRRVSAERA